MADALMKYESIDGKQINQIMEGREPDPPDGWNDNDVGTKARTPDDRENPAPIGGPAEQV
ncbi:ATP-dependent metalloprotease [compost metagenome]